MISAMLYSGTPIQLPMGMPKMGGTRVAKKRLMICAPSNAAIDEIGRRIMKGILNLNGAKYFPRILRVGRVSAVHQDVLSICLVFYSLIKG